MARAKLSVNCVVTRSDETFAAISSRSFVTAQAASIRDSTSVGRRGSAVEPAAIFAEQSACRLRAERIGVATSKIADVRWFVARDGGIYRALVCR
jgi:hypothetical protein